MEYVSGKGMTRSASKSETAGSLPQAKPAFDSKRLGFRVQGLGNLSAHNTTVTHKPQA